MFSMMFSEISVSGTVFENNTLSSIIFEGLILICVQSPRRITLNSTIFINNVARYILDVTSETITTNSYLIMDNCYFKKNYGDIFRTQYVTDIIIYNSHFQYYDLDNINNVVISNGKSIRLWNSTFNNSNPYYMPSFYFSSDLLFQFTMELFTLNCFITDQSTTLNTNTSGLLERAESIGFIRSRWLFKVVHEETKYTPSEYSSILEFSLFPFCLHF